MIKYYDDILKHTHYVEQQVTQLEKVCLRKAYAEVKPRRKYGLYHNEIPA